MDKEEALNTARRLVQQGVDVANEAGIDPSSVVAPFCVEAVAAKDEGGDVDASKLTWCNVPVIVDNDTDELFEMPVADDDPEQQPAFRVTQSTAKLVREDFERYQSSLERMAEDWQEEKARVLSKKKQGVASEE